MVEAGSSSRWWVVSTTASPGSSSASRERAASRISRPGRSRPAPGSSSSSRRGRATSARAISARLRSPWEQSANRRSASAPRPEQPEQRVRAVDVEPAQPLLEVPDRLRSPRCARPARTESMGAKRAPARASTNPIDSRSRATSVRPIVSPRISTTPRLGNSTAAGQGQERRLARAVRPEQRPALARLAPPSRPPRAAPCASRSPRASARRRRPPAAAQHALDLCPAPDLHWLTD